MIIQNKMPRHVTIGDLAVLIPGANEVDRAAWSACKKIKLVQFYIDAGDLVEEVAESLKDMKPGAAIAIVNATYTLDLLDKWSKEGELHKRVVEAIDTQRALIKDTLTKAEKESEK